VRWDEVSNLDGPRSLKRSDLEEAKSDLVRVAWQD
jgi:hypothetical protein